MKKLSEKSLVVLLCVLWMMLLLQFPFSIACIQKEREALLRFKTSFDDPSHRLASWNGTDCCTWNGVGCNRTTGHVTKINLCGNINQVNFSLSLRNSSIDSSLLELKYLNYLDLSGNYFNNFQLPYFLSSMVELTYLNLSNAYFSGKLPPHLGNLTKLNVLDLSFNWLLTKGDVEWISHLSSLRFLGLTGMDFSKSLNLMQVLSSLPLLSSLRLIDCSLQNIHFSLSSFNFSSFLSRVQLLDLSLNQLNGPIPKSFQNMTSLKLLLDLSFNKFTVIEGGLSSFVRNNCGLKLIDLSYNFDLDVFGSYENESMGCNNSYGLQELKLRGTSMKIKIPIDWLGKFKNLKIIDLAESKLYGSIPTSFGNLSNIEYLDLSNNALSREIPTSFGRLLNLKVLYLSNNALSGEIIPTSFERLLNLKVLDISSNSFKTGLNEAHFVNLSKLHTLKLGYNELLSLNMKSNWIPPFQLEVFDATSCIDCFESEFPQWLQTQKALLKLSLSNTSLTSSLPTWFTPHNLTMLDLSHNQMVGPIFINILDQMTNLECLFLNDNLINDSLPHSLCRLKSLETLDLSNNRLFGSFQGCLLTPNFRFLDLSWNDFSGNFPYSHGKLFNIIELLLRNNNFEGSMPMILKNSKVLEILDMEGNKFSGNIPTWIGDNLESLQILRLRSNLFSGNIPSNLCKLINLQILDLAHNQLEGNILQNLSNFNVMIAKRRMNYFSRICWHDSCLDNEKNVVEYIKSSYFNYTRTQLWLMVNIDLSNNFLVGFIPSEITLLKGLIGLNLSHNNLIGTIPTKIGEMKSLQSLDLSFNILSGPIPQSLSKLDSLGVLKLSHNNFSGHIPREGHLSTFNEASSFDENQFLCGDPLPIKCAIENSSESSSKSNLGNIDQEENRWEKWLLYIMIILGFIVGFWTVVGALIFNKTWRYSYFNFVDDIYHKVLTTIQS